MSDTEKLGCALIEQHIEQQGYDDLPNPFATTRSVEVYINGAPLGMNAPGDSLPFVMALVKGAQIGTLAAIVKQRPFALDNFIGRHAFDENFTFHTPNGDVLTSKDIFSRTFQAFSIADPDHLREHARAIQSTDTTTLFAFMETGLPELYTGSLLEVDREMARRCDFGPKQNFGLANALSETPYFLTRRHILPDQSVASFLQKSGAMHDDVLKAKFNRSYFWENLIWGAFAPTDRNIGCQSVLDSAVTGLGGLYPGFANRMLNSLDFLRLEESSIHKEFLDGFFAFTARCDLKVSMLTKIGILQAAFNSQHGDRPPLSDLLSDGHIKASHGQLDIFDQAPQTIVHHLLMDICQMQACDIGLNVFSALSMVSRIELPTQLWEPEVVSIAMNKVLEALVDFEIEHAPPGTTKAYIDESALRDFRHFNNGLLKKWGLDSSIFTTSSPRAQDILALSDFDLASLGDIDDSTIRKRMEMDLGL